MVTDSTQKAVGQVEPYEVQDVKERFDPMGMAVEQGQTAIVAKVKADELETARVEEQGRFARAVADAMKPAVEVGALDSEGKTVGVPLEAPTMPEPRETVMAGISNVGINGRKGVFSELPFEAEDIPNGWEVIQTNDGGYMATPQEHVNEVVENERAGKRSKSLGYMDEKKETHDRVVQIKTKEGHVLQDESTDEQGQQSVIENALDIAGQINGTASIMSPQESLAGRQEAVEKQVSQDTYDAFSLVEGARKKVYEDSQGLKTVGVGFNMEQMGAEKLWNEAGIKKNFDDVYNGRVQLDDMDMQALLGLTIGTSEAKAQARAKSLGVEWAKLPEWHRAILTDIAFNTGSVTGWSKVFTETEPRRVLQQARRLEGGKHTAGMDNRVAKIGMQLGIISTNEQAKKLGLGFSSVDDATRNAILKKRAKAQPTVMMASNTTAGL